MRFPTGLIPLYNGYLVDASSLTITYSPSPNNSFETGSVEIIVFNSARHTNPGVTSPITISSISQSGATWTLLTRNGTTLNNTEVWYKIAESQNTNSLTITVSATGNAYYQVSHFSLINQSRSSNPLKSSYSSSGPATTTTFPAVSYSGSEFSRVGVMIAYRGSSSADYPTAGNTAPYSADAAVTGQYYCYRAGYQQKSSGGFPISGHIYGTWEIIYIVPNHVNAGYTPITSGALNYYNKDSSNNYWSTTSYATSLLIPNIVQPFGMVL